MKWNARSWQQTGVEALTKSSHPVFYGLFVCCGWFCGLFFVVLFWFKVQEVGFGTNPLLQGRGDYLT